MYAQTEHLRDQTKKPRRSMPSLQRDHMGCAYCIATSHQDRVKLRTAVEIYNNGSTHLK